MVLPGFSVGHITVLVETLMTPAKNQRQCRSYCAFSTTDSRDRFVATDNLSPLSEPQLADCDTVGSAHQDGLMDNGFDSFEKNAMNTEASQIHTAIEGTYQISSCSNVGWPREVSRDARECPSASLSCEDSKVRGGEMFIVNSHGIPSLCLSDLLVVLLRSPDTWWWPVCLCSQRLVTQLAATAFVADDSEKESPSSCLSRPS